MKIKQILFLANKGVLILQLKHWRNIIWLFLKNKVLIILVVVVVVRTFYWTIVGLMYFCHNVKTS